MDEIAEKAELSKGTLYYYFSSKHDILGALQIENMDVLFEWFTEAEKDLDDPGARLIALSKTYTRFIRERLNTKCGPYILQQGFDLTKMSEEIRQKNLDRIEGIFQFIYNAIQDGMDRGIFRSDIDSVKMSLALWGAAIGIHTVSVRASGENASELAEAVSDEFFKLIPRGLMP